MSRRQRVACAAVSMLVLAPCASAFTVEIGEIVGVRNVEFSATALDRAAVLQIVNHETTVVECELHFDSGPQDRIRRIDIPPLSTKTVNQSIRPDTLKVRVSGSCK